MKQQNTLVVVGTQWGDEGKGKITDFYANQAQVVVRYQGGNNAGHTIVFDGQKYALQSIPSGIFNPHTKNVMANGMVINPKAVLSELDMLHSRSITDYQLFISDRAAVVMPYHPILDKLYETCKGGNLIGTTQKGIGPAYTDKASRNGIRMSDLLDREWFAERLRPVLELKNQEIVSMGGEAFDFAAVLNEYYELGQKLSKHICDTSVLINDEIEKGSKVLFEGAQGIMLCLDHGTYPYVTSSSPSAASIPINAGIAPRYIQNVLGVCKAYTTRVGEGPFPTEIDGELAHYIRERGHEYGTVTGRPRRVGWLDAVLLNHARRVGGVNYLSIMLLDVLSGMDKLLICTGYELDGKVINIVPPTIPQYKKCKPIYEELPGWAEDITGIREYGDLPENAKNYLQAIEKHTNTKVGVISVGPDRKQTIVIEKSLF